MREILVRPPRAGNPRSPETLRLTAVLSVVAAILAGVVVVLLFDSSGATARTRQSETLPAGPSPLTIPSATADSSPSSNRQEMVFIGRSSGDELTLAIGIIVLSA